MSVKIDACSAYAANKPGYNPKRKEEIDATHISSSAMAKAAKVPLPLLLDPNQLLIVQKWKGHKTAVTQMSEIKEPSGFITCGQDKYV